MRAQVEGRPAAVSTAGQDEITEMAKATQFFVTRIADREAVLRAVFDNMAGARRDVRSQSEIGGVESGIRAVARHAGGVPSQRKASLRLHSLFCRRGEYGPVDEDERVRRYD